MQVLGVSESVPASLVKNLREGMAARGSTGVVELSPNERTDELGEHVDVHAVLEPGGAWHLAGDGGSLRSILDELAPRCRYAIVLGGEEDELPTLHVEDGTVRGGLLSEPLPVAEFEVEVLLDRLDQTEPWESLQSLVAAVKRSEDAEFSGAIATFTGRVRAKEERDDERTERLEFEKYGGVAEEQMEQISQELAERDGVQEVLMHHRTGVIPAGVDIVFVVVLAGHREEAFRTVEDGINRLKAEVPIFKKEVTVGGEFWVHDRP